MSKKRVAQAAALLQNAAHRDGLEVSLEFSTAGGTKSVTLAPPSAKPIGWLEYSELTTSCSPAQEEILKCVQNDIDRGVRETIVEVSGLENIGESKALDRCRKSAAFVCAKCNWARANLSGMLLERERAMTLEAIVQADFDVEFVIKELNSEVRKLGGALREAIREALPERAEQDGQRQLFGEEG